MLTWATAMLMDMMLPIYPSIVLSQMGRGSDKLIILLTVEGALPSAKAKTTPSPKASEVPAPKAEPKGKATPVPKAGDDQAPRAGSKETKQTDTKIEVKREKLPAIAGARLRNLREKGSLVGIRRRLQKSQRSGRHRRDPMLTAGQV